MDYTLSGRAFLLLLTIVTHMTHLVSSWGDWEPNFVSKKPEIYESEQTFRSENSGAESFKLLLVEGDKMFIGGRDRLYYLRTKDLRNVSTLSWKADDISQNKCRLNSRTDCTNYIRVAVRKAADTLYICGTNAYSPICRHYYIANNNTFSMKRGGDGSGEDTGTAICPFDADSNATAVFAEGKLYSATRSSADGTNPLILQSDSDGKIRTGEGDSEVLNEPQFVSSFEKDDKVYFFFRETAVENINCGKTIFSRVARVCKKDSGGFLKSWRTYFTSFMKARLNCSMPGHYPFYFDEIQSTSEFGQGNYMPTSYSGDRSTMVYGIFNTPSNSIHGSAICAFTYSDIVSVFEGQFKGQDTHRHNWLPVPWDRTPVDHPSKCVNNSRDIPAETVQFTRDYPMMDMAVRQKGGRPMLVWTSLKARFTQIAIDWQLLAADSNYYDVMFVGTDDGRIIKAINKGTEGKVDTVVIEERQVLEEGDPVVGLKLIIDRSNRIDQKLVVVSKGKVVGVPLQRCERATTCGACVAMQDPYCVWSSNIKKCVTGESGIQSIESGEHTSCAEEDAIVDPGDSASLKKEEEFVEETKTCTCPDFVSELEKDENTRGTKEAVFRIDQLEAEGPGASVEARRNPATAGASLGESGDSGTPLEIVIVAVMLSTLISLIVGFAIGYKFQACRAGSDDVFQAGTMSLQRSRRNRLSSGDNPHFHTDQSLLNPHNHSVGLAPKQMNVVLGKGNQTSVMTKSNKVYL